jgi:hypothetical protein
LPTLRVNTRGGYRPGLDDIIAFATTAAGQTALGVPLRNEEVVKADRHRVVKCLARRRSVSS